MPRLINFLNQAKFLNSFRCLWGKISVDIQGLRVIICSTTWDGAIWIIKHLQYFLCENSICTLSEQIARIGSTIDICACICSQNFSSAFFVYVHREIEENIWTLSFVIPSHFRCFFFPQTYGAWLFPWNEKQGDYGWEKGWVFLLSPGFIIQKIIRHISSILSSIFEQKWSKWCYLGCKNGNRAILKKRVHKYCSFGWRR